MDRWWLSRPGTSPGPMRVPSPRKDNPMNRVSRTFQDLETLLEDRECARPVEAVLVRRVGLIETLQRSLAELHEQRRMITGAPAEVEAIHRIKYWDAILVWLKDQEG